MGVDLPLCRHVATSASWYCLNTEDPQWKCRGRRPILEIGPLNGPTKPSWSATACVAETRNAPGPIPRTSGVVGYNRLTTLSARPFSPRTTFRLPADAISPGLPAPAAASRSDCRSAAWPDHPVGRCPAWLRIAAVSSRSMLGRCQAAQMTARLDGAFRSFIKSWPHGTSYRNVCN